MTVGKQKALGKEVSTLKILEKDTSKRSIKSITVSEPLSVPLVDIDDPEKAAQPVRLVPGSYKVRMELSLIDGKQWALIRAPGGGADEWVGRPVDFWNDRAQKDSRLSYVYE